MNPMYALLLPLFLLPACASVEGTADDSRDELVYQTGSNIPSKYRRANSDRVKNVDKEWVENEIRRLPPGNHPDNTGGAMSPRGTNPM